MQMRMRMTAAAGREEHEEQLELRWHPQLAWYFGFATGEPSNLALP